MEKMAELGWTPNLQLWEEPGTIMGKITPVQFRLTGVKERQITTYTCSGGDYSVMDAKEYLWWQGFTVHMVPFAWHLPRPCLSCHELRHIMSYLVPWGTASW